MHPRHFMPSVLRQRSTKALFFNSRIGAEELNPLAAALQWSTLSQNLRRLLKVNRLDDVLAK